jgi:hypothetical protein
MKRKGKAKKIKQLLGMGWEVSRVAKELKLPYGNVYWHKMQMDERSKPIKIGRKELLEELKPGLKAIFGTAPAPQAQEAKANEVQVGGAHYKALTPQPWDVINAWRLGFLDGNVVKYVARFRNKGGVEDLKKAKHYLDKLIEVEEKK